MAGVILPSTWTDVEAWSVVSEHLLPDKIGVPLIRGKGCLETMSFHSMSRLHDGRLSILLDIGSVGNLTGDATAREIAKKGLQHGKKPNQLVRDKPLNVSGVGKGSQKCLHNCKLPVALNKVGGGALSANFETPVVPDSELPALLGLDTVRRCRGIIDTNTLRLYLLGPGEYNIESILPSGTEMIQCELAPSGHMVIPCDSYDKENSEAGGLTTSDEAVALPVQASPQ